MKKETETWKYNYKMHTSEWKKDYFKRIIGGIPASEEERLECMKNIEESINQNNEGIITEINKENFLKTYPESLDILEKYYNSLKKAYDKNGKYFDKNQDLNTMLLVYAPYFSKLSLDELKEYAEAFNISLELLHNIIVIYKRSFSKKEEDKIELTKSQKYDLTIIEKIADEIIDKKISKEEIAKKYNITIERVNKLLARLKEYNPLKHEEVKKSIEYQTKERWKNKYSMTKDAWDKEYFKEIIGGIEVSEEEKKENYNRIEKAIHSNKKGELTRLNKNSILKAYPDSINLLKEYYDSLKYAHIFTSGSRYNKYYYYNTGRNKTWEETLIEDRNTMLMIYAPYLSELPIEELTKYAEEFNLSFKDISNMLKKFRTICFPEEKEIIEKENKEYDLKVINQITHDILENNYTKKKLLEKYKLSPNELAIYGEKLKEINIENYQKVKEKLQDNNEQYYDELQNIISIIYNAIINGIEINENKVSFTMLDYYSICKKDIQDIFDYINAHRENNEIQRYKNRVIRHLISLKEVGSITSAEEFANQKISLIYKDNKTEFDKEISEKIINFLNENEIPPHHKIVYTAARRYARGEPILPLKKKNENQMIKKRALV